MFKMQQRASRPGDRETFLPSVFLRGDFPSWTFVTFVVGVSGPLTTKDTKAHERKQAASARAALPQLPHLGLTNVNQPQKQISAEWVLFTPTRSGISVFTRYPIRTGFSPRILSVQIREIRGRIIVGTMGLSDQIQKDIITAMKARDEARLSTLRMVKTALKNREIEKMAPLDDKESQQVLGTLIKQRKDSVEQFTKGGRQEMADKEAAEIVLIESYMPKAAGEAEIIAGVKAAIAEMGSPTMKDMGTVMKTAMAKFSAQGMRVDGKVVSEAVKKELAGK